MIQQPLICVYLFSDWQIIAGLKDGINLHTLYDLETQITAFFHITDAAVQDSKTMKVDRTHNNFMMLYRIHQIGAYFVVRAKKNLHYKPVKRKRSLPKNVLSDGTIESMGFYPKQYYPELFAW